MKKLCDDLFLPSDLLMEILSRLPVKILMRFRCVSRSWKSLIGDLSFVKLHLEKSPKNTHILLALEEDIADLEEKDDYVIPRSVRCLVEEPSSMINDEICYDLKGKYWVFGSCNGLVWLGKFYDVGLNSELRVKFWNPATRLRSKKSQTLRINLQSRVDVPRCKVNLGFGYDDSCDTYKMVAVLWNFTEQKIEMRVHYMADGSWRNIPCESSFPLLLSAIVGVFVGGCVYWLALENQNGHTYEWDDVILQQLVIVSFDMSNEVYSYMSLPQGISEVPHAEPQLVILGNHMCLCYNQNDTHFILWQMRKYGVQESWTRLVSVTYEHLQFEGFSCDLSPMWVSDDGNILLIANREDLEVIKYNVRDQSVEHIQYPDGEVWTYTIDYIPSLVSPCQN